jgi:hypothetical protein
MSREEDKMRAHDEHRRLWRKARRSERPLTPKQRVLKRWPNAEAVSYAGPAWVIYNGEYVNQALNVSDGSAKKAWKEAAKHRTVRRVERKS